MDNLKLMILSIIIAIVIFVTQKQVQMECNSPNSVAEKVNFGGKNCPKK